MAATHIQSGITNHRINREPLDAETINLSYAGMIENIKTGDNGGTIKGAFYKGLVTTVNEDPDSSYNGLWLITGVRDEERGEYAYSAAKIATKEELDNTAELIFDWGHL